MSRPSGTDVKVTPLGKAMVEKDLAGFEAILRAGADPNVEILVGEERETLLLLALSGPEQYGSFLSLLLEYGADVNTNIGPWYPLTMAFPDVDIVCVLLRRGADPNVRGLHGRTALMNAIENGLDEIARLLLEHGADPSIGVGSLGDGPNSFDAAKQAGPAYEELLARFSQIKRQPR